MDDTLITFTTEDGEEVVFEVVETAKLSGKDYLLVQETGTEDDVAYIMQKTKDENGELTYVMVEDDDELSVLCDLFDSLLEDVDVKK